MTHELTTLLSLQDTKAYEATIEHVSRKFWNQELGYSLYERGLEVSSEVGGYLGVYMSLFMGTVLRLQDTWQNAGSGLFLLSYNPPLNGDGCFSLLTVRVWKSVYLSIPYLLNTLSLWVPGGPNSLVDISGNNGILFSGCLRDLPIVHAIEEVHHLSNPSLPPNHLSLIGSKDVPVPLYDSQEAEYQSLLAQLALADVFGLSPQTVNCIRLRLSNAEEARANF